MDSAAKMYVVFRALRWLSWIAYILYSIAFIVDRSSHLDHFGNLLVTTELIMFGLPVAAVFLGFFEMMTREMAGFAKPTLGRLLPEKGPPPKMTGFEGR